MPRPGSGLGAKANGPEASDLAFLDNIEELNTNWPDYQVRAGRNGHGSMAAAAADGATAAAELWVSCWLTPFCCGLQEFQNTTDDVFGQLLSGREAEKEQSAGPPDW